MIIRKNTISEKVDNFIMKTGYDNEGRYKVFAETEEEAISIFTDLGISRFDIKSYSINSGCIAYIPAAKAKKLGLK